MTITELLIQLVRMITRVLLTKLKQIIDVNANKTKYNLAAHNEMETCSLRRDRKPREASYTPFRLGLGLALTPLKNQKNIAG